MIYECIKMEETCILTCKGSHMDKAIQCMIPDLCNLGKEEFINRVIR
jgi:hypothetical protein